MIGFNRPDTMQQVFDAVRLAQPSKLYFAVDGARKGKNEDERVQQVRDIVKQVDWPCEVHTLFRDENVGCGFGPVVAMLLLAGDVYQLVFITGFVGFSAALLRYTIFIKKSRLKINRQYFEKTELIGLFSFSVWVLVIQLSQMFRLNLIPTVLSIFNNTTVISVFSVGRSLEGMVYTISAALNGLFLPMVSRMAQSDDKIILWN